VKDKIRYHIAYTDQDFENGKKLFEEYAHTLNVDLSFQNFSKELETIDKQYNHPEGGLLLAQDGTNAVGCAGVRKLDNQIAELKRMYVQNAYRGYQIGLRLLEQSIELAKELGYQKIRLDTLENMHKAQELYRSFGFYEIPSYRFNPLKGTIYMEKEL
jgi:ribosomal protein S18 acetylase RimI-like enzyme